MEVRMEAGWKNALMPEFSKPYFQALAERVRKEYSSSGINIYPPAGKIWAAFDSTPFDSVKVVIIGQDPYHGPGQANGLAFSVNKGIPFPPSLRNIFEEIKAETGTPIPADGDLTRWATQGVLLLNSSLCVREGSPASLSAIGWEEFTDAAVRTLAEQKKNLVFLLWGRHAIDKQRLIPSGRHLILTSPHPSPLSAHRGFMGNGHFLKTNEYLISNGKTPIQW